MCGIAGFWGPARPADFFPPVLEAMCSSLRHRGPDSSGTWSDPACGLGLAHTRLAILDLTPAGHQPMHSADGRFCTVFNGEVYNYAEFRRDLEETGHAPAGGWRGHSDTEAILAAARAWGLEKAVHRFVGMFALALWDARERTLTLLRDRLGIKPLYYGYCGDTFLFGSQPGALRRHPGFDRPLSRPALAAFLRTLYVPAPLCIHDGIRQLEPGCLLTLTAADLAARRLPEPRPYWTVNAAAEAGAANPFTGDEDEAEAELTRLLDDAVGLRLIADVPLGAFLSGGVDSSTVVALMQRRSSRKVRTFTIGFTEPAYDESGPAREVARHLGTDHTELILSPEEARAAIPSLPRFFDEPFADASMLPTFLVSRLARQHVTVSLSGDGGDELFGGYNRYLLAPALWRAAGRLPRPLRRAAGGLLAGLAGPLAGALEAAQSALLPPDRRQLILRDKLQKLSAALSADGREAFFHCLASFWQRPAYLLEEGAEPPTRFTDPAAWPRVDDYAAWMMAMDLATYLPGDILAKVDRASMAVALEARVPLLDHRVAEFALSLPLRFKIRDGQGKRLLRRVLYRHVPRQLIERPKQGFGLPIDAWLRGPLRAWAEDLLAEPRLRDSGFRPAPVRRAWSDHLAGRANRQYHLWAVLMYQAWRGEHGL
ncbi:MAG: asparagine synthase (glutamine-hydrolyzing) [Thermodesulfobacteriota bacterium]